MNYDFLQSFTSHQSLELQHLGGLFTSIDIDKPKVDNLIQALHLHLLGMQIMLETIEQIQAQNFIALDATVCDCKCQVRASMILDLVQNISSFSESLRHEENKLTNISIKTKRLLDSIDFDKFTEIKKLIKELDNASLAHYFKEHQLFLDLCPKLKLTSFCYFVALKTPKMLTFVNNIITPRKIEKLRVDTKTKLCVLSIAYEQKLAKIYGSKEEQKILTQVETKRFCSMTAFFPSFKPIFTKMKQTGQSFIQKNTIFCSCGGKKSDQYQLFASENNTFILKAITPETFSSIAMIIEGYQFPGSFNQLQELLGIPVQLTEFIPKEFQKPCRCTKPIAKLTINNIEQAVLANFAQHRQFITDAPIDFEGLELADSDLKKEYDYLQTLDGFSINDMSKFCIRHIYASTIEQALQADSIIND